MSPNVYSAWVRTARGQSAFREAGAWAGVKQDTIRVQRVGEAWAVSVGAALLGDVVPSNLSLEEAIVLLDEKYPPPGWERGEDGAWTRPGWACRPAAEGTFFVLRVREGSEPEPACGKAFVSADRARAWAEVRLDRTHLQLRGPRPRGECRANAHLPDVRVTDEERKLAMEVAERLGLPFSEMIRASVKLLNELSEGENPRVVVDRSNDRNPALRLV